MLINHIIVILIKLYHITQCEECKRLVSISDGKRDKLKLLVGDWKTHLAFHMMRNGKAPNFKRWFPVEAKEENYSYSMV